MQDAYQNALIRLLESEPDRVTKSGLRRQIRWAWMNGLTRKNHADRDVIYDYQGVESRCAADRDSKRESVDETIHRQRLWWAVASVLSKAEMELVTADPPRYKTAAANRKRRLVIRKAREALKTLVKEVCK